MQKDNILEVLQTTLVSILVGKK